MLSQRHSLCSSPDPAPSPQSGNPAPSAQSGNPAAGIALLREYLDLNPRDQGAASSLADVLIQNGELQAARELAGRLLAHDPQYPVAHAILERIRGQEEQE